MKESLHEILGDYLSQPTISRRIKQIGVTRKRLSLVPAERNTAERKDDRLLFITSILNFSTENLVYLDETGFNNHTGRSYGYSNINQKAFSIVPVNKGKNRSLMCAISIDGVIAYEYKSGAYNSELFVQFIIQKLVPYFRLNPTRILIMDNARFHKSNIVLEVLRQNNIVYKISTPYSPELNPIEEFFAMIKMKFHAVKKNNAVQTIEACLDIVFQ